MLEHINDFLDRNVLPWPVRFLTFRFVILATMLLLIPLIFYADHTIMVLGINSYLNVMSVAVSSIVLLYATIAEVSQKRIARLQEQRAQEDHQHVTEMHQLVLEEMAKHHEEIEDLKELLAMMYGKTHSRRASGSKPNLRELHPRGHARYAPEDGAKRLMQHALDPGPAGPAKS
jgi:hypothetical protein